MSCKRSLPLDSKQSLAWPGAGNHDRGESYLFELRKGVCCGHAMVLVVTAICLTGKALHHQPCSVSLKVPPLTWSRPGTAHRTLRFGPLTPKGSCRGLCTCWAQMYPSIDDIPSDIEAGSCLTSLQSRGRTRQRRHCGPLRQRRPWNLGVHINEDHLPDRMYGMR